MLRKKRESFSPIGQILLRQRVINELQLEQALLLQQRRQHKSRLGTVLIEMGYAKEDDLLEAFSAQYAFPFLPLDHYCIETEILHFIPCEVARKYCIIPVSKIGTTLTIAVADLLSAEEIAHIEAVAECKVHIVLAKRFAIQRAIDTLYRHGKTTEAAVLSGSETEVAEHSQSVSACSEAARSERRSGSRVTLDWDALILLCNGEKKAIRVVNVSSGGAAVIIDEPLSSGERIQLLLFNASFLAQMLKPEFQLMQSIRMEKMSDQLAVMLSAFCDFVPKKQAWVAWCNEELEGRWRVGLRFALQPHPSLSDQVTLDR